MIAELQDAVHLSSQVRAVLDVPIESPYVAQLSCIKLGSPRSCMPNRLPCPSWLFGIPAPQCLAARSRLGSETLSRISTGTYLDTNLDYLLDERLGERAPEGKP